jgi:YidC/Oxa1 family membrane protein insertase
MDNQRLFLFVALSFVVLLIWQAWMEDYGPAPQEGPAPVATDVAALPEGRAVRIYRWPLSSGRLRTARYPRRSH